MTLQNVVTISHGVTDYLELEVGDLPIAVAGILARGIRIDGDALVIGSYLDAVGGDILPADTLSHKATEAALLYMASVVDVEGGEGPRVLKLSKDSWALGDILNAIMGIVGLSPNLTAKLIASQLKPLIG